MIPTVYPVLATLLIAFAAICSTMNLTWPGIGDAPWKTILRVDAGAVVAIAVVWIGWGIFA